MVRNLFPHGVCKIVWKYLTSVHKDFTFKSNGEIIQKVNIIEIKM